MFAEVVPVQQRLRHARTVRLQGQRPIGHPCNRLENYRIVSCVVSISAPTEGRVPGYENCGHSHRIDRIGALKPVDDRDPRFMHVAAANRVIR